MNKFILLCLAMILAIYSCKKEVKVEGQQAKPKYEITGEWQWLKSYGGFAGLARVTPENTGIQRVLKLYTDNRIEIFENDTLIQDTEYFVSMERSVLNYDTVEMLTINYVYWTSPPPRLDTLPKQYILRELSDSLIFDDNARDGLGHTYYRVK